jgi:hypothetical protein
MWDDHPYAMTPVEAAARRLCQREHREHWAVVQRKGNASAFNGYRWQPSDYSQVSCNAPGCHRSWRTKAAYVDQLPGA